MDVVCERCQTEYEFDDALVSERGTTVKCTNCGQQFKVYRPKATEATPERWVVRQQSGRELVFTTLRDLQRAISQRQVGRDDTLSRGAAPPRPLGSIAELEPFFASVARTAPAMSAIDPAQVRPQAALPPVRPPHRTDPGIAPAAPALIPARTGRTDRPPPVGPGAPPPAAPPPGSLRQPPPPKFSQADGAASTLPQFTAEVPPMQPAAIDDAPTRIRQEPSQLVEPPTVPRQPPNADMSALARTMPVDDQNFRMPLPTPPPRDVIIRESRHEYEMTPSDVRASYGSDPDDPFTDPRFAGIPPKRSRALRWIVALVVLGMVGVVAGTVGRKYIEGAVHPTAPPQASDARVAQLLQDGERALADGDLDGAKEAFDKASVLVERDAKVLADLARLDAVRADVPWLKLKLLAPDQADAISATKRELHEATQRAKRSADRASEVAADDPVVVRAKVDALRLADDRAGARGLVARIANLGSQPETSYVLAALDLAEDAPMWPTVIDRLRVAASGEQNLGRARGALVYALARSGDLALARSELDKILASPRPFPLVVELKAFVSHAAPAPAPALAPDAGKPLAAADAGPVDIRALPIAAAGEEGPALPGDFHEMLKQASAAKGSGQLDRAEQLYQAALAKNPGDTEALGGLGDIAKARGNASAARNYYEQVHQHNPGYLPVTTALADMKWDSGDRAGAIALYRQIVDANPNGTAATRAKERISSGEGSKPSPGPSPTSAPAPTAPPTGPAIPAPKPPPGSDIPAPKPPPASDIPAPKPPPDTPPDIDTSDLPGFKKK